MDKHILHLYENPFLKAGEVKIILSQLCSGELSFTEKFDGQFLLLSYSTRDSEVKLARNAGHLKQFGLSISQFQEYYKEKKTNPELINFFVKIAEQFEVFANTLSVKSQIPLFGQTNRGNPTVFWMCESINPGFINVLPYDGSQYAIFHQTGHKVVSEAKFKVENFTNDKFIQAFLKQIGKFKKGGDLEFLVNEPMHLKSTNTKQPFATFLGKFNQLLRDKKLRDDSRIVEILMAFLDPKIAEEFKLPIENHVLLTKRIIADANNGKYIKRPPIKELIKNLNIDDAHMVKDFLREVDKVKSYFWEAIRPLELMLHEFGVSVLSTLNSRIFNSPDEFNSSLKHRIKDLSNNITPDMESFASKHMTKIGDVDKLSINLEGIVFQYKNYVYKITGNFAPVNQLLGYHKYRKKDSILSVDEFDTDLKSVQGKLCILPGAFKPPHKGHFRMLKHYIQEENAERVVLIIGKNARPMKHPDTHKTVGTFSFAKSKELWEIYLNNEDLLHKVTFLESSDQGPVVDTYKFIETKTEAGDIVVIGVTDKNPGRFNDIKKVTPEGVKVQIKKIAPVITFANSNTIISATQFRDAIAVEDKKAILEFVPISSHKDMDRIFRLLFREDSLEQKTTDVKKNAIPLSESILVRLLKKEVELDEATSLSSGAIETGMGNAFCDKEKKIRYDGYGKIVREVLNKLIEDQVSIVDTRSNKN